MVCSRCKMLVEQELTKVGLHFTSVQLGVAEITGDISPGQQRELGSALLNAGLVLMDDKRAVLVRKIKDTIIALLYEEEPLVVNLSVYLSRQLNCEYTYLSNVFSEGEGGSIEKFYITQKINRVKELIAYKRLSVTEIAFMMHYSSVAHLSSQFKKCTGITPSRFKQLTGKKSPMVEKR